MSDGGGDLEMALCSLWSALSSSSYCCARYGLSASPDPAASASIQRRFVPVVPVHPVCSVLPSIYPASSSAACAYGPQAPSTVFVTLDSTVFRALRPSAYELN